MAADRPDRRASDQLSAKSEPLVDLSVRNDAGCVMPDSAGRRVGQVGQDHPKSHLPALELASCHSKQDARPKLDKPPNDTEMLRSLNGKFDQIINKMKAEGHHWDTFPWLQNLSEERKCYSQANEMGQALRQWIDQTPGLKGNFQVQEGTINEGKGADPRDFYSGNGEHNFIVITNLVNGSKYYGDPWSGRKFSTDPQTSVHNFKGQKIWEHGF